MRQLKIIPGKLGGAMKVVIYGPEGIGKSTLAAKFPRPLFIDTEGSTRHMDVQRTERPTSWAMLLELVRCIKADPGLCSTLVIDTADWAEQLCITSICDSKRISGIEDMGYGKGYVYVAEEFGRLLNLLEEAVDNGIHVVLTAHAIPAPRPGHPGISEVLHPAGLRRGECAGERAPGCGKNGGGRRCRFARIGSIGP